jgi:hypothetical protein
MSVKSVELRKSLARSHALLIEINFNVILQSSPRGISPALDFWLTFYTHFSHLPCMLRVTFILDFLIIRSEQYWVLCWVQITELLILWFRSFIHSVICLTTGPTPLPKRFHHIVRSRASSFKWEYPLLSLRSSSSFLRLLPRLLVTSDSIHMLQKIIICLP